VGIRQNFGIVPSKRDWIMKERIFAANGANFCEPLKNPREFVKFVAEIFKPKKLMPTR